MKTILSTLIAFFIVISGLVAQETQAYIYTKNHLKKADKNVVLVTAHRAAHQKHPENSIASILEAIRIGVDIVELDIRVTKDGVPILMHDDTIDRTTNASGKAEKMTYEALQEIQLLGADGKPTPYKIPSLEAVLQVAKGKIWIDLDIKTSLRQLDAVVAVLQKTTDDEGYFFYDGDYKSLKRIRKKLPNALIMLKCYPTDNYNKKIKRLNPDLIHLGNTEEDKARMFLDELKPYNKLLFANALGTIDKKANDAIEAYDLLLTKPIHIIQTDYPMLLLNYLRLKKMHL